METLKVENATKFSWNVEKYVIENIKSYQQRCLAFDVTLCCIAEANSNKLVYTQAHKTILSIASPVIRKMLNATEIGKRPCTFVFLAGVSQKTLSYLLNYIYNGEIQVPKECEDSIRSAAEKLQIKLVETPIGVTDVSSQIQTFPEANGVMNTVTNSLSTFDGTAGNTFSNPNNEPVEPNFDHLNMVKVETKLQSSIDQNTFGHQQSHKSANLGKIPKVKTKLDKMKSSKMPMSNSLKPIDSSNLNNGNIKNSSPNKEQGPKDPLLAAEFSAVWKKWKEDHTKADGDGFHCLKCPDTKTFTQAKNLNRHYKQAHEQTCKFCKYPFINEEVLQQHIQNKHEFKCSTCDKSFTQKKNLQRHQKNGCNGAIERNLFVKTEVTNSIIPNSVKTESTLETIEDSSSANLSSFGNDKSDVNGNMCVKAEDVMKKEKFKKPKIPKSKSASQKVPTSPNTSIQQKMKSEPSLEMNNNLQDVNMETFLQKASMETKLEFHAEATTKMEQ